MTLYNYYTITNYNNINNCIDLSKYSDNSAGYIKFLNNNEEIKNTTSMNLNPLKSRFECRTILCRTDAECNRFGCAGCNRFKPPSRKQWFCYY